MTTFTVSKLDDPGERFRGLENTSAHTNPADAEPEGPLESLGVR